MAGRPTETADRRALGAKLVRPVGARRRRAAMVVATVLLLAIVAAILVAPPLSRPLVEQLAESWLRAHGADARVEVTALSPTTLTARVRLGDRNDPDLTIDRVDVTYALSGPWNGGKLDLTPSAVRLVRPRLEARLRTGSLEFGQLAGIIDWALRRPPTGQPLPDITIVNGQARLATPDGTLRLTGDATYSDRRQSLVVYGGLAPFRQVLKGAMVSGDGGVFEVVRRGRRLAASAQLAATSIERGAEAARVASLDIRSDLPWPERPDRLAGPAALRLSLQGLSGAWGTSRLADGGIVVALNGALNATRARQHLAGALTTAIRVAEIQGAGTRSAGFVAGASLPRLDVVDDAGRLSARSGGALTFSLDRIATANGAGAGLAATAKLDDGALTLDNGVWSGRAALAGRAFGRAGLAAPLVRQLVAGVPAVSGKRPFADALGAALHDMRISIPQWRLEVADGRRARIALTAPARLNAASGATVVLSGHADLSTGPRWRAQGAGAVSVSGGGLPTLSLTGSDLSAGPGGLQATLRGHGALDTDFASGAEAEVAGRLALAKGWLRLDLLQCAPLKAQRLAAGEHVAQHVSLRLCPAAGPVVEAAGGRWRAVGRIEGLRGDEARLAIGLRDADATFDVGGGSAGAPEARLAVTSAAILDLGDPVRFRPLTVQGDLRSGAEGWRGVLTAFDRAKRPLARLTVAASAAGPGRLDIDTGVLTFAPGGLQPVDLTPLAAGAREVSGEGAFRGWLAWGGAGRDRSGGELLVRDLGLTGPTGPVTKLNTRVVFTSLSPLTTAPDQQLAVAEIASIAPLTNLKVVFDLRDDTLNLRQARGELAGGQVNLRPVTLNLHAGSRVDGALEVHRVNLGEVLAATSLADQVKLQAIVDGLVPFSVGPDGIAVKEGVLSSVGGGRLSISRAALGAPGAGSASSAAGPAAQGGVAQDFAYQALENLAFDSLEARLNTLPKDRLGVIFHIKGRHDPPKPVRALIRLADVMRGRALQRPLALPSETKIDLTLDTSLNFGELIRALAAAWQDAMRPASIHPEDAAPGSEAPLKGAPAIETPAKGDERR